MSDKKSPPGWSYEKRKNLSIYVGLGMIEIHEPLIHNKIVDCYFDYKGFFIVHLIEESDEQQLFKNKHYHSDYTTNEGHIILYKIPDYFQKDLLHFIEGRYSKFSDKLRSNMYRYSGLQYHNILFYTITKEELWREELEKYYGCEIPYSSELLSKPADRNFKSLDDFFKDELEDERQNN